MEALVIVGHGSHLDPHAHDPVYAHADAIRDAGAFDEVREAFWKEEPSLREVLRTLASETVSVVPLFTSEGYFTERVVPRELRIADGWSLDVDKTVRYTAPVGTHEAMADVIVSRAESVTGDPAVGPGVGLVVVGHGTERHAGSGDATRCHAERLRALDRFDEVRALFLDQDPRIQALDAHVSADEVVVVPLFVADGYHTRSDIPAALGVSTDDGVEVPADVDGRRIWYAGAVGTEPVTAAVIAERAAAAGAAIDDAVLDRLRAGPRPARST